MNEPLPDLRLPGQQRSPRVASQMAALIAVPVAPGLALLAARTFDTGHPLLVPALATAIVGGLVSPADESLTVHGGFVLVVSAGACLLAAVLVSLPLVEILLAGAMVALMMLTFGSVRALHPAPRAASTQLVYLSTLACLLSLPLVCATALEVTRTPVVLTSVIVSLSPLTHLALVLDHDYLRDGWLYQHSRLGGMRIEPVPVLAIVATYLVVATGGLALSRRATRLAGREERS